MKRTCWVVQYHHRHGVDAWPMFCVEQPDANEVAKTIEGWEGDERDDEYVEIVGPFDVPDDDA